MNNFRLGKYLIRTFSTGLDIPLKDTFNRFHNYLRISVTERCNFRCVYCMPAQGLPNLTPNEKLLSLEEYKRLITLFSNLGVTKLRITGGEPTVYKKLPELIAHAKSHSNIKTIGITTNALKLSSSIGDLVSAGLTSVNISLDTLKEEKFETISRLDRKGLMKVLSGIYAAIGQSSLKVKLNCVLMRGINDDELGDFASFLSRISKEFGYPTLCPVDLRFIEIMPFDDNKWNDNMLISYVEAVDMFKTKHGIILRKGKVRARYDNSVGSSSDRFEITADDVDPSDTTKWYHAVVDGVFCNVGFITSMSSNFCGTCNRLRITADGVLKTCLFGADENGFSLLQAIRVGMTDDEIIKEISAAVKRKKKMLGGNESPQDIASKKNRPMILIGG